MARLQSQKYFDSAQDYRWEVVRSSMNLRKYLIRYDPIDSYDSSRRSHFTLIDMPPFAKGVMQESDFVSVIEANAAAAVWKWNLGLEQDSEYGTRDFQRLKGTATFPGLVYDSFPDPYSLNPLTKSYDPTRTIDSDGRIRLTITPSDLSDSEKADRRSASLASLDAVWNTLSREGRLDSAIDLFGLDSLGNLQSGDVNFLRSRVMFFGDSTSDTLQNMYGYNDSDWAYWMMFSASPDGSPDSV